MKFITNIKLSLKIILYRIYYVFIKLKKKIYIYIYIHIYKYIKIILIFKKKNIKNKK